MQFNTVVAPGESRATNLTCDINSDYLSKAMLRNKPLVSFPKCLCICVIVIGWMP